MVMRNKKGMEMAVTTVIMIILSITVLTILVIFFNSQTGFLDKWFKTQSTASNIDAVVSACDGLVTSQSIYAYCCEEKEIRFGEKGKVVDGEIVKNKDTQMTCEKVAESDWGKGRVRKMECDEGICA